MKKLLVVPIVFALTACGTFETNTKLALNAPEFGSKPSQGDEVKYPKWFTEKEKDGALYAVATEYSKEGKVIIFCERSNKLPMHHQ